MMKRIALCFLLSLLTTSAWAISGLRVKCDREGADVYLNGKRIGSCPGKFTPKAGDYTIRLHQGVSEDQEYVYQSSVSLSDGDVVTVDGRLSLQYTAIGWQRKQAADAEALRRRQIAEEEESRRRQIAEEEESRRRLAAEERERQRKAQEAEAERLRMALLIAAWNEQLKPYGRELGQSFRDCPDCPDMVVIPAGSFDMGSNDGDADEKLVHRVTIGKAFALAKTEVTQGQWKAVMGSNPSHFKDCGDNCPVEQVSWDDAQEYIRKLNQKTGKQYRLPSEAEWEYAARAGTTSAFSTGNCINTEQANYNGNYDYNNCGAKTGKYRGKTIQTGSFPANAFGLYDMHGNVWEWVQDCYNASYSGAPTYGGAWTSGDCTVRALRGGSWGDLPDNARSAVRNRNGAAYRSLYIGFRPARMLL